jgi:hypothetical protein
MIAIYFYLYHKKRNEKEKQHSIPVSVDMINLTTLDGKL